MPARSNPRPYACALVRAASGSLATAGPSRVPDDVLHGGHGVMVAEGRVQAPLDIRSRWHRQERGAPEPVTPAESPRDRHEIPSERRIHERAEREREGEGKPLP